MVNLGVIITWILWMRGNISWSPSFFDLANGRLPHLEKDFFFFLFMLPCGLKGSFFFLPWWCQLMKLHLGSAPPLPPYGVLSSKFSCFCWVWCIVDWVESFNGLLTVKCWAMATFMVTCAMVLSMSN